MPIRTYFDKTLGWVQEEVTEDNEALDVTPATTIEGALTVNGATTLAGTLVVTGAVAFDDTTFDDVTVNGVLDVKNTVTSSTGGISGMSPFVLGLGAITAAQTLTKNDAGIWTVSGDAAVTTTLPVASTAPGAFYTFRSLSVHSHVITASGETSGVRSICMPDITHAIAVQLTGANGSAATLNPRVGSSVSMLCDGVNWLILATSGTVTVSGA